jgi:hypothetical protein
LTNVATFTGTLAGIEVAAVAFAGVFSYATARLVGGTPPFRSHVARFFDATSIELFATPLLIGTILSHGALHSLHEQEAGLARVFTLGQWVCGAAYLMSRLWYVLMSTLIALSVQSLTIMRRMVVVIGSLAPIIFVSAVEVGISIAIVLQLINNADTPTDLLRQVAGLRP